MRAPIEHRYTIDGEAYRLREATFEEERLLKQHYALALTLPAQGLFASVPGASTEGLWQTYSRVLDLLDGADLYDRAVTQVCLREAPALWWQEVPGPAAQNGAPRRVLTFSQVEAPLWRAHRQELRAFLDAIFRADAPDPAPAPPGGAAEPVVVAPSETLSPVLRGRAE